MKKNIYSLLKSFSLANTTNNVHVRYYKNFGHAQEKTDKLKLAWQGMLTVLIVGGFLRCFQ